MIKIVVSEQVDAFRMGWVCGDYFLRKLITSNISKRITEEFRLHNPCAEKSIGHALQVGAYAGSEKFLRKTVGMRFRIFFLEMRIFSNFFSTA